jgi:hypothetical protein
MFLNTFNLKSQIDFIPKINVKKYVTELQFHFGQFFQLFIDAFISGFRRWKKLSFEEFSRGFRFIFNKKHGYLMDIISKTLQFFKISVNVNFFIFDINESFFLSNFCLNLKIV